MNELDKRIEDPSSREYRKALRRLYNQKYLNTINYWASFRDFAKASKAESSVIQGIENRLARVKKDWKSIQEFL